MPIAFEEDFLQKVIRVVRSGGKPCITARAQWDARMGTPTVTIENGEGEVLESEQTILDFEDGRVLVQQAWIANLTDFEPGSTALTLGGLRHIEPTDEETPNPSWFRRCLNQFNHNTRDNIGIWLPEPIIYRQLGMNKVQSNTQVLQSFGATTVHFQSTGSFSAQASDGDPRFNTEAEQFGVGRDGGTYNQDGGPWVDGPKSGRGSLWAKDGSWQIKNDGTQTNPGLRDDTVTDSFLWVDGNDHGSPPNIFKTSNGRLSNNRQGASTPTPRGDYPLFQDEHGVIRFANPGAPTDSQDQAGQNANGTPKAGDGAVAGNWQQGNPLPPGIGPPDPTFGFAIFNGHCQFFRRITESFTSYGPWPLRNGIYRPGNDGAFQDSFTADGKKKTLEQVLRDFVMTHEFPYLSTSQQPRNLDLFSEDFFIGVEQDRGVESGSVSCVLPEDWKLRDRQKQGEKAKPGQLFAGSTFDGWKPIWPDIGDTGNAAPNPERVWETDFEG